MLPFVRFEIADLALIDTGARYDRVGGVAGSWSARVCELL
jgi:hypothetical protein